MAKAKRRKNRRKLREVQGCLVTKISFSRVQNLKTDEFFERKEFDLSEIAHFGGTQMKCGCTVTIFEMINGDRYASDVEMRYVEAVMKDAANNIIHIRDRNDFNYRVSDCNESVH